MVQRQDSKVQSFHDYFPRAILAPPARLPQLNRNSRSEKYSRLPQPNATNRQCYSALPPYNVSTNSAKQSIFKVILPRIIRQSLNKKCGLYLFACYLTYRGILQFMLSTIPQAAK
jgi:hypothetical protein